MVSFKKLTQKNGGPILGTPFQFVSLWLQTHHPFLLLHLDHLSFVFLCQDLAVPPVSVIRFAFISPLYFFMTNPSLSRKERRALQRQTLKNNQAPFPHDDRPRAVIWPFIAITLGFVFCLAVFALVVGANLWMGHSPLPRLVGWGVSGAIGIGAFAMWVRRRKQFRFAKKWLLLFPLTFGLGVVLALAFVYFISVWQETTQLDYREHKNKALIERASAWTVGTHWSADVCQQVEAQQREFANQLYTSERTPYVGEVLVLFGTVQASYQAGCAAMWDPITQMLTANNPHWKRVSPQAVRGFNNFVWAQRPGNKKGCQMELARLEDQETPLASALKLLCDESPDLQKWVPGANTAQAQRIVQYVQKTKEAKTEPPTP